MNAASLDRSKRLRRVLNLLRSRGAPGPTTREIIEQAHVCAVNSIIAELRANGQNISCHREGHIYRYALVRP